MTNEPKQAATPATKPESADAPTETGKKSRAPRVETKPLPRSKAAELLTAKWGADAKRKFEAIKKDADENQYYLTCMRNKDHHAAYLTERPEGTFHPGMWYSVEHEAGEPWPVPYISCQECLLEGETRRWNVSLRAHRMPDGNFAFSLAGPPNFALLRKVSRQEIEERVAALEAVTKEAV